MQKIKVIKVESKPTAKGGTMVAVFDEKNTRFSGFLKELQDVKAGDTIEAEIQVDGKYNNITAVKILEHGQIAGGPSANQSGSSDAMSKEEWAEKNRIERNSIEAQVAFKGIMEVAASGYRSEEFDLVFYKALDWASEKLGGQPVKPVQQAPKVKSEADKDWDKIPSGSQQKQGEKPASTEERLKVAMDSNGYNWGHINSYVYKTYGVTDWKKLNAAQYNELLTAVANCQVVKQ